MTSTSAGQRGFSLIPAIFLLVVIAALGTFAVTLFTTQQQTQVQDVMGSRAYQAARAGIEWAALNVALSPASSPAPWAECATGPVPPLALSGQLSGFGVAVGCAAASAVEGESTVWSYDVTAKAATTGLNPGDAGYVERVISVKLGK